MKVTETADSAWESIGFNEDVVDQLVPFLGISQYFSLVYPLFKGWAKVEPGMKVSQGQVQI